MSFSFAYKHHRFGTLLSKGCLAQIYKKGVGVCFSAHPGTTGSRIAQITQDRQRQLAHASTNYINKVYRNALRRRFVVICLL